MQINFNPNLNFSRTFMSNKSKKEDAPLAQLKSTTDKKIDDITHISKENALLVHMSNYQPYGGVIKSTKAASLDESGTRECRNTVHFSVNHSVQSHELGDWSNKSVAVLAPLNGILKENPKESISGGMLVDFFIKDKIKLPQGSVIVRQSDSIPKGTLRVLNAEDIDGYKNTKGIKIVETNGDVKQTADKCIDAMGYSNLMDFNPDVSDLEQMEEYTKKSLSAQTDLIEGIGAHQYAHTYSVYGRSEMLLTGIQLLASKNNDWKLQNDDETIDYQEEFLKVIDEINEVKKPYEKLSYDIDALKSIVTSSKTPQDALDTVAKELQLRPTRTSTEVMGEEMNYDKVDNNEIAQSIDFLLGISEYMKDLFRIDYAELNRKLISGDEEDLF